MAQTGEPGRLCRLCREPIAVDARKCPHCGASQDWRRLLDGSTTVLALLVALVSIVTAALPVVSQYLADERSLIELSFDDSVDRRLILLAWNGGTRPGRISDAELTIPSGNTRSVFRLDRGSGSSEVFPGEWKTISFIVQPGSIGELSGLADEAAGPWRPNGNVLTRNQPDLAATLTVRVIQFGGRVEYISFPVAIRCFNGCTFRPDERRTDTSSSRERHAGNSLTP